ncbi:MAG TPA: TonB-dependent receptor [Williamwhitmania sp.]|nr:TonB-dependent receptor [Williamwhitmania sp.]
MIGRNFLIIPLLMIAHCSFGQEKYTVSGYLKDKNSGETLIGATVFVKELQTGAAANAYGFYSITLPKGTYTLQYSFIGYSPEEERVVLNSNMVKTIELAPQNIQLETVVISSKKKDENVTRTQMSMVKMDPTTMSTIPVLMGESDIMKTLQLMPGVQAPVEGSSGFNVRGGSADQNLILLDEAPVYNAAHLLGFFSIFNSDAIKDVTLYKGDIPAAYGGRLSSLLDIRMKDGNDREFHGSGGIGIISSRLALEGPLKKGKGSFFISGRRTYADLFLKRSTDSTINKNQLYFYDINAKLNYQLNDNNKLFLSGYYGRDFYGYGKDFFFGWGNATLSARWNHLFTSKLFSNFTVLYSNYHYGLGTNSSTPNFKWTSSMDNLSAKYDFTNYYSPSSTIRFGLQGILHYIQPGKFTITNQNTEYKVPDRKALEYAAYIQHELKVNEKLSLNYGLRFSMFQNIGTATIFEIQNFQVIDTVHYGQRHIYHTYMGLEPRFSATYLLDSTSSIKASYSRTRQYLQLASNSVGGSPLDVWFPASSYVKPQISDQVGIGYFRNFKENTYECSVEGFYKYMRNQIDFKDNANLILNNQMETELRFGNAKSYGIEVLLRKNTGKLTGWISYTLSKALRDFPDINHGKEYVAGYDHPNNIAIVASYNLSPRVVLSANWVYYSGTPVTYPTMRYTYGSTSLPVYGDKNGNRLPAYHRLDLSLTLKNRKKPNRHWEGEWNFSIYNAYNRANAYSVYFEQDKTNPDIMHAYKMVMFRLIPSITYNFKF